MNFDQYRRWSERQRQVFCNNLHFWRPWSMIVSAAICLTACDLRISHVFWSEDSLKLDSGRKEETTTRIKAEMLQETTQCHLAASINLLSLRPEHVLVSNEIGNLACSEMGPFLTPGWD